MSPKRNAEKSDLVAETSLFFDKGSNSNSEKGPKPNGNKFVDILHKTWKVFRVSPILNFSKSKLRLYEKKLNEEINSKKKITSNVDYKSKLTLNKNLRLNDECDEAFQVEIIKNDSQSVYVGHFISCGNAKSDEQASGSLLILLVEGKAHVIRAVHSSLCKIFDCDIQSVTFSFYSLISFFVKLLEPQRNNVDISEEKVTMEYGIPECEAADKIKVSLFLEGTILIYAVVMDGLKKKYEGINSMEIILAFYNKILNHIYHVFKMDLMFAELQKISFPDAFLTNDGQVKISTDDAAVSTFEILVHFTPLDAVTNV